ncbi:hypothetical protein BU23DRAFT_166139 [Bimuria novae-zelandiae CBS 107.79]|uniref:Uncharacterized protein n=1 Tax=Bimuria novae-zelandiae CBS 107.79 TaxID=1447943 RepID=A0A6A5V4E1_9PLEO|nr:hypothetical protein BU23DRAFT_166139 [Bimuria novae-zelandiae CBS 107.79]
MSRPHSIAHNPDDKPPLSPIPPAPKPKATKIREIVEHWERPASAPQKAEPVKPRHDLKEEYKGPWTKQREERARLERVWKGEGRLRKEDLEPWQRGKLERRVERGRLRAAKDEGGGRGSEDGADSEGEDGGEQGDGGVRGGDMLPPPTTLARLPKRPVLPASISAFEWALEPWLVSHPSYRAALAPTTPWSSSLSSFPSEVDSSFDSAEVSVATDDAFPEIPLESMGLYVRSRDEVLTRVRMLHVRTLLLRCAVLWRTAWALETTPLSLPYSKQYGQRAPGDRDDEEGSGERMASHSYKAYSTAGRTAEKAEKMARDLGVDGLQARAWYWRGRADAGRRYWDEAAAAFRRARELDRPPQGRDRGGVEEYGRSGLTPWERKDAVWLGDECTRRDEAAQARRLKRMCAREEGGVLMEMRELEDEDEEDEVPLGYVQGDGGNGAVEEEYVDVAREYSTEYPEFMVAVGRVKEKYKSRPFVPFSEEEWEYILHGDEGKKRKDNDSD